MARIDPMGGHLIGVHIDQRAEVLMGGRAMIAFQEVVDDVLPVRLDIVGQSFILKI